MVFFPKISRLAIFDYPYRKKVLSDEEIRGLLAAGLLPRKRWMAGLCTRSLTITSYTTRI